MNKLCVDLGGTKTAVAVYDDLGNELSYKVFATEPQKGVDSWLDRLFAATDEQVFSCGCIASPGPLDVPNGTIVNTPTMGWKNIPIVQLLQQKFSCKFWLLNDCDAGALGIWRENRGHNNIAYLSVSTGVGGGMIIDGKLYTGNGNAAEFGHVCVGNEGRKCGCGRADCLELYASGSGMEKLYLERTGTKLSCAELANRAESDGVAKNLLKNAGQLLNTFLKNLNTVMDFDAIYVGGSVAKCQIVFDELKRDISNVFAASADGKQVIRGALEYLCEHQ